MEETGGEKCKVTGTFREGRRPVEVSNKPKGEIPNKEAFGWDLSKKKAKKEYARRGLKK